MSDKLINFPYGPLDKYRSLATFDWKKMKVLMTSEEILKFEQRLHEEFKKHALLYNYDLETPPLDEQRRITAKKLIILEHVVNKITNGKPFTPSEYLCFVENIFALDANLGIKYTTTFDLFPNVIRVMGTQRHGDLLKKSINGDIYGCFCYSEIAYGADEEAMRTTATYDVRRKQFILNTPDFKSAKSYVSLGKTAHFGVVYAQLILPNGENKGLHGFVVEIHDSNLKPCPGVIVGDMGEKAGLNGVDHAFIRFNTYPIPRENMLNRIADVTEDGGYITHQNSIDAHKIRHCIFSIPRIRIITVANAYLVNAITIAIRYAGVRKQFSPSDKEDEVCIIEYQTHQYRLLPYLALTYALKWFTRHINSVITSGQEKLIVDMEELHAISSGGKAIASWFARDGIQECREACGGHGYLKATGIGELRSSNDYNCTVEGDNYEELQQTSDWLLPLWPLILKGDRLPNTLMNSVQFLNSANEILKQRFVVSETNGILQPECILNTYKWLVCYMLKSTYEKYQRLLNGNAHSYARSESQIFYAKTLATAYIQHLVLDTMLRNITQIPNGPLRTVLVKLFQLLGCWMLEQHMSKLHIGGYIIGPEPVTSLQNTVLTLCKELKNEAIGLIDAIACPDFMLNSILGNSDGEVYKHLQAAIYQHPTAFARPSWWQEVTDRLQLNAKL
ncbi:hypothetical protein RI129_013074 [Pyrocoelia pectoralis]|uniref:Acyl-coenzyme A oxidase n=1 Tax=Pyrocoelia pectoralis TaxID=417401 RepID=A0AAN7V8I3_9COLE